VARIEVKRKPALAVRFRTFLSAAVSVLAFVLIAAGAVLVLAAPALLPIAATVLIVLVTLKILGVV